MSAPVARTVSGARPLTVAWVPTGMNAGVRTAPCGVVSSPQRAAPSVAMQSEGKLHQTSCVIDTTFICVSYWSLRQPTGWPSPSGAVKISN